MIKKNKGLDGWLTTKEVADSLEISPNTIRRYYHNNKQSFEGLIVRSDGERALTSGGTLLWSPEAQKILGLGIKNKPVEEWKEIVTTQVAENGIVITTDVNPLELTKAVCQQIIQIIDVVNSQQEQMKQIELKMNTHKNELKAFEQKYEDERIITPQTRKRIKDIVTDTRSRTGQHWGYYWSLIWRHFKITTITDTSEKLGQEIIKWLEHHPEFYVIVQNEQVESDG